MLENEVYLFRQLSMMLILELGEHIYSEFGCSRHFLGFIIFGLKKWD
jgi:hypothetical protein